MSAGVFRWRTYAPVLMLLIGMAVSIVAAVSADRNLTRLAAMTALRAEVRQTRLELTQLLSMLKDVETAQRGYILTGNEAYLQPYRDSADAIPSALARVSDGFPASALPQSILPGLAQAIDERLRIAAANITVRRDGGRPAVDALDAGKAAMDHLRLLAEEIDGHAFELDVADTPAVIDSTAPDGPVERTWSDAGLIDDLNVWLATPSANFGWALLGDEATSPSAQRFYSRESAASGGALRPILDLTFLAPPPPTPLEAFLRSLDPDAPAGTFYDLTVDTDGDGLTLLLEHGLGLDGLSADPPQSTGLSLSTRITGTGTTEVTATFRRDPGATGVRLALQVASGFSGWMPVAESLGGAAPTALNGAVIVSDLPFPGGEASRLVTVRFETAENIDRRFLRLEAFLIP